MVFSLSLHRFLIIVVNRAALSKPHRLNILFLKGGWSKIGSHRDVEAVEWLSSERLISQANITTRSSDPIERIRPIICLLSFNHVLEGVSLGQAGSLQLHLPLVLGLLLALSEVQI